MLCIADKAGVQPIGPRTLILTLILRPNSHTQPIGLPFIGLHPRNLCNYMDYYSLDYYSFTDPKGMKGWVGLVGWPIANILPTKWSHVSQRLGVYQGKSASQRPTS